MAYIVLEVCSLPLQSKRCTSYPKCLECQFTCLVRQTSLSPLLPIHFYFPTENDDYTKCAGDAMKKRMISAVILLQHQVDPVINDLKYIECMENQAKTCTVPIMEHFMGQLEVYKKHLKELMGK